MSCLRQSHDIVAAPCFFSEWTRPPPADRTRQVRQVDGLPSAAMRVRPLHRHGFSLVRDASAAPFVRPTPMARRSGLAGRPFDPIGEPAESGPGHARQHRRVFIAPVPEAGHRSMNGFAANPAGLAPTALPVTTANRLRLRLGVCPLGIRPSLRPGAIRRIRVPEDPRNLPCRRTAGRVQRPFLHPFRRSATLPVFSAARQPQVADHTRDARHLIIRPKRGGGCSRSAPATSGRPKIQSTRPPVHPSDACGR